MWRWLFIWTAILPVFVLTGGKALGQGAHGSISLQQLWITERSFSVPESVCYDSENDRLLVASVGGKSNEKEGKGFISVLSLDGKLVKQVFVHGLNAPKGMGIFAGKLYVADIDRVAEVDLKTGSIARFYKLEGAEFLNDIAINSQGTVYVSDTKNSRIYRISGAKAERWLEDPMIKGPNGLFVDHDRLLIGCGKIIAADLATGKLSVMVEGTGNIDGLKGTGDGRFLFSDWLGGIFLVNADRKVIKITDLSDERMNAADIEYIPQKSLLLVPTFLDNRVVAFHVK